MGISSLQIQSVIYKNDKKSLHRAMTSISNAIKVDRTLSNEIDNAVVHYGDASPERVFSDEEVASIAKEFEGEFVFKYTYFNENTGTAKGHNLLADECEKEYIMVMNPDVLVCPDFFGKMFAPFRKESLNAGLTEARQTPLEHPKKYDFKTFKTEWASTACVIFPKAVFDEINGFDNETFFMYCDDVDFSWRIRLTGKNIYYCPDAFIYHAKQLSKSGAWQPTSAEVYYTAEAALLMAYKWSNESRLNTLIKCFTLSNNEQQLKAVEAFKERKANNKLPLQIDKNHKVSRFVGDCFTEHRFTV